jgi:hypothetical protein
MLRKYCSWDSEGKRTRWVGIDSLVLVSNYRTDESSEVFGRSQAIISNTIVLVLGRTTRIDLSIYLSPSPTLVFFYRFRQQAGEKFSKPRIPMPTKG